MLDADWSFVINRTNGNLSLRHALIFDSLAGAIAPGIYGRKRVDNPIDPNNDTLNFHANLLAVMAQVERLVCVVQVILILQTLCKLYAGAVGSWKAWTFDKDGNLTLPGSLVVPVNTWLSFALGSGAGFFIKTYSHFYY